MTSIRLIERKHADSEGGAPPDNYTRRTRSPRRCCVLMRISGGCAPRIWPSGPSTQDRCVCFGRSAQGLRLIHVDGPRIVHALSLGVDMEPTLATRLHARDEPEKRVTSLNEDDERGAGAEENAAAMSRYATWFHINLKPT